MEISALNAKFFVFFFSKTIFDIHLSAHTAAALNQCLHNYVSPLVLCRRYVCFLVITYIRLQRRHFFAQKTKESTLRELSFVINNT